MCEACFNPSRRRLLTGSFTATAVVRRPGIVLAEGLEVEPRASWAGDGRPPGDLEPEPDVRVLLVHHSASPNSYQPEDVPGILQGFWAFHTGPEKGWPDIAYNFLIDRFGTIWEGRAGSVASQVRGDATGGNQGFSQLVCLIGNFESELPTPESRASLERLLAWMADRAGVDPSPGARAAFVSLGSNRHPEGSVVDTATITGHRTMSLTSCPGDTFAPLVETEVAAGVVDRVAVIAPTTTATSTTEPPTTEPAETEPFASESSSTESTGGSSTTQPPSTGASSASSGPLSSSAELVAPASSAGAGRSLGGGLFVAAGAMVAAVGGLVALRRRAGRPEPPR